MKFKEIYDGYMLVLMVFIGLFLLLRDVPLLRKKKLKRDMKIAKALGYVYIIGGIALFVMVRIF
ncbi:CLC_0170 family protein [Alkaliphilus metalliredigens]|nr:CLC_0170 family protein [Alkaliphilus metalliredigens]